MLKKDILPYKNEIIRKLIHLSSLWMPAAILWLGKWPAAGLFGAGVAIAFFYEFIRHKDTPLAGFANKILNPVLREKELGAGSRFTGATYVTLAAFIVTVVFPANIAIAALCIMLLADTAAALVGKRYGKIKLGNTHKTLEGSIAFFVTAFLTVMFVAPATGSDANFMLAGIFAAAITTLVELVTDRLKIDDNLSITICAAVTLFIFSSI